MYVKVVKILFLKQNQSKLFSENVKKKHIIGILLHKSENINNNFH